jgi:hypothetical protein
MESDHWLSAVGLASIRSLNANRAGRVSELGQPVERRKWPAELEACEHGMRFLAGFLLSLALVGCATPSPTPTTTLAPAPTSSPSPSSTQSPPLVVATTCIRDNRYWPRPSIPPVDPCPFAIAAISTAVAGLGPITQIYLVPDAFRCDEWWGPAYPRRRGAWAAPPSCPAGRFMDG